MELASVGTISLETFSAAIASEHVGDSASDFSSTRCGSGLGASRDD